MHRLLSLTPWLLAVFPVLSLWRRNFDDVLATDVVAPALAALVLGSLVSTLCWALLRERSRSVVLALVVLTAFFTVVPLANMLGKRLPGAWAAWIVSVLALAAIFVVARTLLRRRAVPHLASVLSWLVVFLLVWEIVGITAATWQARTPAAAARPAVVSAQLGNSEFPDIYHIMLDGYGSTDVLRDYYAYDNTPFLQELRALGFHVTTQSRANYVKTLHALASILNMAYVQELVPVPADWQRSKRLVGTIQSNRVVHMLRQRGYSIHAFESGYTLAEFSNPDFFYVPERGWSEFEAILLRTTPLRALLGAQGDLHARHRERLQFILDKLPDIEDGKTPRYVFAHLLAPHPPFVVDRDGNAVPTERDFGYYDGSDYMKRGGTLEGYRHDYAEQARYVSKRVAALVREILQESGDRPPIILLHSDHGPGSGLDWSSLYDTDMHERFGILCAVYLPGYEDLQLPEDLSPVNLFRLVFDLYFGTEMRPLAARSYYTWQSEPFHYFDVTVPDQPREHVPAPKSGF